jgi:hypothetical protein
MYPRLLHENQTLDLPLHRLGFLAHGQSPLDLAYEVGSQSRLYHYSAGSYNIFILLVKNNCNLIQDIYYIGLSGG